jgi:hypothetical protein
MKLYQRLILAVAAVAMLGLPTAAAAQAGLKPQDAAKFIGGWTLGMETPQGAMSMNLTVKDDGGKVAGSITSDMQPEAQAISDISKDGDNLVLKYMLDFQGQAIPAKITLTPDGDKMKVAFDFADGQFVMDGSATKK